MKIYTIFDVKAQESGPLFILKNDSVATRMFKQTIEKEIVNGLNPNDFELYCVGCYDNEKMEILSHNPQLVPIILNEEEN